MFRRMLVLAVTTVGLATLTTPDAQAGDFKDRGDGRGGHGSKSSPSWGKPGPGDYNSYKEYYRVLYRKSHHAPWCEYGTYHSHRAAHEVEHRLEHRGFEAKVVHHR